MFGELIILRRRWPSLPRPGAGVIHPSSGCYVMIIYGTNGTHLRTDALPSPACPACGTGNALRTSVFSRYAHIYWIPLFPYTKLAVVQCGACQTTWDSKALPTEVGPAVLALKRRANTPAWTWAGLGLVALLLSGSTLYGIQDTHDDDALLTAPRAGDIYTVHTDSANMYSLLKVCQVGGNGVELVANDYETPDSHPISALDVPEKYSKEPFVITRLDLQIMRRKGTLIDVDRP